MPINNQYIQLIRLIDQKMNDLVLLGTGEDEILVKMLDLMPDVREMIGSVDPKELDMYLHEYPGFFNYMKILESLARGISDGTIDTPAG